MNRARAMRIVRPVVGLGLLAWLLASVDLREMAQLAAAGQVLWLVAAAGSLLLGMFLQAVRLHILIRRFTQSFATSMKVFLVGMLFNNVLPSGVGGDAVRLMYLGRMREGGWAAPLGLLLLHRTSGLVVLLVAAGVAATTGWSSVAEGLVWRPSRLWIWIACAGVAVVGIVVVLVRDPFRSRLRSAMKRVRTAIGELGAADWGGLLVFTVGFHGLRLLAFVLGVEALGSTVGVAQGILVLAAAAAVALLPVSVGGLGLVEGSIALSLTAFGVPAAAATGVALLNRLVLLLVAALGGVVVGLERARPSPQ